MADRFDKFTERARRVLTLAQEETRRLNCGYIGTEHILLGLLREGEGIATGVLDNFRVTLEKARNEIKTTDSGLPPTDFDLVAQKLWLDLRIEEVYSQFSAAQRRVEELRTEMEVLRKLSVLGLFGGIAPQV